MRGQRWKLRQWLMLFIALLYGSCAFASSYPTDSQLRKAIVDISGLLKTEGLQVVILDAQKEGISLPLMVAGLSLTSGACLVFYNSQPVEDLERFFAATEEKDLSIWLNAIAVHEVTHCIEQREAYVRKRFEKVLPPGFKQDNLTVQGYLTVIKSGVVETWGEALADIAAVLYFKSIVPAQWQSFANRLATMREELAFKYPEHNTAPWLHSVINADIDKSVDQNIFDAAFQLRKQFRPD